MLVQSDIEGKQSAFESKSTVWEFNTWLIIAMLSDTFYFGKKANFFTKSSMLISSFSIITGLASYQG